MTEPDWWPRDPHGYVFLARVVEIVGSAMHDDWTGLESSTKDVAPLPTLQDASFYDRQRADILFQSKLGRPDFTIGRSAHEFTDEQWRSVCELAEQLHREGRPAVQRLLVVQTEIVRRCEAGELVLRVRPTDSGPWQPFQIDWWNTDKWRSRFDRCKIDPDYPNGNRPSWRRENNDHDIFVTHESLKSVLDALAPDRKSPRGGPGRKPGFQWEIIETEFDRLMDHHDDFAGEDPEWNAQARLEDANSIEQARLAGTRRKIMLPSGRPGMPKSAHGSATLTQRHRPSPTMPQSQPTARPTRL
jgi:hypothetical protein